MNDNKLGEALARLQDEEWKRLEREDGPVHVFSETFESNMKEILQEEKRMNRRKRVSGMRNAAAVFALCILAALGVILAGRKLISPDDGSTEIVTQTDEKPSGTYAGEVSVREETEMETYRYSEIRLGIGAGSDPGEYTFTVVNDSGSDIRIRDSWRLCYLGSLQSGRNLKTLMQFLEGPYGITENTLDTGRSVTVIDLLSDDLETEDTWISAGGFRSFAMNFGKEATPEAGMYLLTATWSYTEDWTLTGEDEGAVAVLFVVP